MSYTNATREIHKFLGQFATVYRNFAPKEVKTPYIVYRGSVGNFTTNNLYQIQIFANSFNEINSIVSLIESKIDESGLILNFSWGGIVIFRGEPFAQDIPQEDIKGVLVNLIIKTNIKE